MNETDKAKPGLPPDSRFWQYARMHQHPKGSGKFSASFTGVGGCGDAMRVELYIENHVIEQVRCQPEGCVYTAACAGAVGELARGCTLENALQIQPEDVACELGGLPDDHMHCARLAVNTLGEAIAEYYRRQITAGEFGWKRR